ncbi:Uncharacterised protein [Escherichia coli]|uniref:Uncharacterized protein n=1 Tax=Escherichia coli TaxID=562 RepID=A0A377B959_ECOLX|nr:Uncharacterised protein [Escherichia coli]
MLATSQKNKIYKVYFIVNNGEWLKILFHLISLKHDVICFSGFLDDRCCWMVSVFNAIALSDVTL